MITPDHAMEQAHATARKYAYEGIKAFEALTGLDPEENPQAMAVFVSGFMQAASTDFAAWAVQKQLENISASLGNGSDDLISLLADRLEGKEQ
jgi:hypothetical protein